MTADSKSDRVSSSQAAPKDKYPEELFHRVVESVPHSIVMVNEQGKITLVNSQTEELFGYTRDELIGQDVEALVPQRYRQTHRGDRATFMENPSARPMGIGRDLFGQRRDGSEFPVEIGLSPIEVEQKTMILASIVDITERKHADERNRFLANLVGNISDAVIATDMQQIIESWNAGAEKMYGWKSEEVLGRLAKDVLDTDFVSVTREAVTTQIMNEGRWSGEVLHSRRDGTKTPVLSSVSLYKDSHGKPAGIVAVNRDITDRKQVEEEIRRLNEELEQRVALRTAQLESANKELEAFSYSVSHDLRAPLRSIDGFARILQEDYASKLDAEGQRYLKIVSDNTRQMGQLIDDLLTFSRVSRQLPEMKVVSLTNLTRDVLAALQPVQDGRKVEVVVKDLPNCKGDPNLLKQVLVNLLSNALKFTRQRENASVEVGCAESDGENVYYVKDNGAGFDMKYADKLFNVFQRLHRADEFEGTGVGLAIVQRVIHRHGGRVWAEAAVDQGATFYFTLPAVEHRAKRVRVEEKETIEKRARDLV